MHSNHAAMLIETKIGQLESFSINHRLVDYLPLQWHETGKRIMVKQTLGGTAVTLRFLNERPQLTEGDVLYADEHCIVAVTIAACECIVVTPANAFELANICYEIGNKHLPLFFEANQLLVPFEMPLFNQLSAMGYAVAKAQRKLLQALKTTVAPHSIDINPAIPGLLNK